MPKQHKDRGSRASIRRFTLWVLASLVTGGVLLQAGVMQAEPVAVRYTEGVVHGFLALHTLEGKTLALGDLTQLAHGNRVTSRLVFHFRDGSIHDETVVYSQRGTFRLLTDHLVQKGPAFPHPMEVTIDGVSGQTTVRYTDDDGKQKVAAERLNLPPDVANGLILTLLKNVPHGAQQLTLSMVAATPKPRLVRLVIAPTGKEPLSIGGSRRRATHYVVKVELGGVAGLLAPLVGKQPQDSHVWILGGEAPAFVKAEGPLYSGGPSWRIELVSPVWPDRSKKTGPGKHTKPAGQNTKPAGQALQSAGCNTKPVGQELQPAGCNTRPTGRVLQPAGQETKPAAAALPAAGQATCELSAALQPRSRGTAAASAVIREPGAMSPAAVVLSRQGSAVTRERSRVLLLAISAACAGGVKMV